MPYLETMRAIASPKARRSLPRSRACGRGLPDYGTELSRWECSFAPGNLFIWGRGSEQPHGIGLVLDFVKSGTFDYPECGKPPSCVLPSASCERSYRHGSAVREFHTMASEIVLCRSILVSESDRIICSEDPDARRGLRG